MTTARCVLVVVAHPDDEWSCCGFTALLRSQGAEVHYLCCTDGSLGTLDRSLSPVRLAAIRDAEMRAAAADFGVASVEILARPDVSDINPVELRGQVIARVRRIGPDILVTHDPWKPYLVHPDHRAAGLAACEAAVFAPFPHIHPESAPPDAPIGSLREVWLFDTRSPNFHVDIGAHMERKVAVLRRYPSQMEQAGAQQKLLAPDPRSDHDVGLEMYEALTRRRAEEAGRAAGVRYAEAYRRFGVRNGHFDDRAPEAGPGGGTAGA